MESILRRTDKNSHPIRQTTKQTSKAHNLAHLPSRPNNNIGAALHRPTTRLEIHRTTGVLTRQLLQRLAASHAAHIRTLARPRSALTSLQTRRRVRHERPHLLDLSGPRSRPNCSTAHRGRYQVRWLGRLAELPSRRFFFARP